MRRKVYSFITALALCLSLLPGTAWAAEPEVPGDGDNNSSDSSDIGGGGDSGNVTADSPWNCGPAEAPDSVTATLSADGTLTITGSGPMKDWASSTDVPWNGETSITTVTIGSGVTSIGAAAFQSCSNLVSVTYSAGLIKEMQSCNIRSEATQYVSGELTEDVEIAADATLQVAAGETLTISKNATLTLKNAESLKKGSGTITNNGTITLPTGSDAEAVKKLGLSNTGTGTVEVPKVDGSGTNDTYTNEGEQQLTTVTKLDLGEATTVNKKDTDGYQWDQTSRTLTLYAGFNAETVILPDDTVKIITNGSSTIGTLSPHMNGYDNPEATKTKLTFSGPGPLTITNHVELTGGDNNTLTVDTDAKVTAKNGITIGASSGVNSTITVNGTLTVAQGTEPDGGPSAIFAGQVKIGTGGVLEVSGANGVQLQGTSSGFTNLFVIEGAGRFTANCTEYNLQVEPSGGSFPDNIGAEDVIVLGEDFLPKGCMIQFNESSTQVNIVDKDGVVYKGPLTIHQWHSYDKRIWTPVDEACHQYKCDFDGCTVTDASSNQEHNYDTNGKCTVCDHEHTHNWDTEWSKDATSHWHACSAGCLVKKDAAGHSYDNDQDVTCNICGYVRTITSGGGGNNGGNTGGNTGGNENWGDPIVPPEYVEELYAIRLEKTENGEIRANHITAARGSTVMITITPEEDYELLLLTVTDARGESLTLRDRGNGKYSFLMPGRDVTVKAQFQLIPPAPWVNPFLDVSETDWFYAAVQYVSEHGLMDGSDGLFQPDSPITRAQFAQVLYNKEGKPSPSSSYELPFSDVLPDAWYYKAVRWAASQGIVSGYEDASFRPNAPITREQLAVMLWRYAGRPSSKQALESYPDGATVSAYAQQAMAWAVEQGVISGDNGQLLPQGTATRAQVAQMLKNYLEK